MIINIIIKTIINDDDDDDENKDKSKDNNSKDKNKDKNNNNKNCLFFYLIYVFSKYVNVANTNYSNQKMI